MKTLGSQNCRNVVSPSGLLSCSTLHIQAYMLYHRPLLTMEVMQKASRAIQKLLYCFNWKMRHNFHELGSVFTSSKEQRLIHLFNASPKLDATPEGGLLASKTVTVLSNVPIPKTFTSFTKTSKYFREKCYPDSQLPYQTLPFWTKLQ